MEANHPQLVTIIGAGRMAEAVAQVLSRGTVRLRILARRSLAAAAVARRVDGEWGLIGDPIDGDMVILAVPQDAVRDIVDSYAPELDRKILIDATNPDGVERRSLAPTVALQARVPSARVTKAFNTVFAATLSREDPGDGLPVVLVASDDIDAARDLVDVLHSCDVAAVTVGSLERSSELDALARLQEHLVAEGALSRRGGFALRH